MSYAGLYINLDRCPERRAEIEGELARFGLSERYLRLAAADGNILGFPNQRLNHGEIGCFTSHYLALKQNLGLDKHLHVVEDDAVFAPGTEGIISRAIASGSMDNLDLLYTDVALPLSNEPFQALKSLFDRIVTRDSTGKIQNASFQILPLHPWMFVTTISLLINKNSIEKIFRLYHDDLTRGAQVAIDVFLRQKIDAGILKAGCVFPFITSARVNRIMDSTVRGAPDITLRFTAATIARYSFFIGCDLAECMRMAESLPVLPFEDRHAQILSRVLEFSLMEYVTDKAAIKAA